METSCMYNSTLCIGRAIHGIPDCMGCSVFFSKQNELGRNVNKTVEVKLDIDRPVNKTIHAPKLYTSR